jgi:hypothetical protein
MAQDNSASFAVRWTNSFAAAVPLRARYLIAGLFMGGFWSLSTGPLVNQAVGLLLAVAVLPPVIHVARSRMAAQQEPSHRPRMSLTRLTLGKVVVVALAMTATWLLGPSSSYAHPVVGLALIATVATLGPLLHPRMLVHPRAAATEA